MEASLSSKVTVEYHDPSAIFPLISGDLASRLPLRNLNWKSPSRPLRSIGALHVEFVPDAATAAAAGADVQTRLQRADSYGPRSIATAAATDTANTSLSSGKERRHQIPGLRQTPYLKIYLLRCDDKDTYKSTSRQLVREWIRENTPPPQTSSTVNKLEAHDASEWLILHVVLPDTVAASEPRWTAASKRDPDELVERPQSSAKWPGKSTSTVLDKIRADFNPSTKSVPERVAQIRLQKSDIPQHHLPQNPVPSAYIETKQEQENAWQDLFAKFKTLILMSFDLRVTQYEDDIREKDAQRSLPGWNFCTFFTLKEGLARGFESVGLVEDALAIYDELTLGLESAVTDAPDSAASRGTLLGDLDKYRDILKEISAAESDAQTIEKLIQPLQSLYDQPLDLTKKDYRGEIVKSTISLFDFHLYIFARQRTLLLRLGSGSGTIQQNRPPSSHSTQKDDNLSFPAEVCRRAAAFAATNSRALRIGLRTGSDNNISSQSALLIENLAFSWTYAVLDQILDETVSDKLPLPTPSIGGGLAAPPQKRGSRKDGNFNFSQGANPHPTRKSSLQGSASASHSNHEKERSSRSASMSMKSGVPSSASGIADLAAGRAELYMMQRKIVEAVAQRSGWSTGWGALMKGKSLSDVDLADDTEPSQDLSSEAASTTTTHLISAALTSALASEDDFRAIYEQLTNLALSHYVIASHKKSSDILTSDLAILKSQMGDYAQAATLFQNSSASYLQTNWTYVHAEMLRVYAQCLRHLHRKDEYMRVMLGLLGKIVHCERPRTLPITNPSRVDDTPAWFDDGSIDVGGILEDLTSFSKDLPYNYVATLADFFHDTKVLPEVIHYEDKDGFALDVRFRHLLHDSLQLDRVRLRLSHSREVGQELWLESNGPTTIQRGFVTLRLHSNVTTHGPFLVDKLVLETNKLHFVHEFQPKPRPTPLGITNIREPEHMATAAGPSVLIYPHLDSLNVDAALSTKLHVDQLRCIVLDIDTGRNDIEEMELRLRAASAGLRLHTADAALIEGSADLDTSRGGLLTSGAISSKTKLQISLPYSIEHNLDEVVIKLEAQYRTASGSFVYIFTAAISVDLPLDVDVHDIFKAESLFSRFSIRTTNSVPLQITDVKLRDSAAYSAKALPCPPRMMVFEKQPANLTYEITKRKLEGDVETNKKELALAMTVTYSCLDEVILGTITASLKQSLLESPFANLTRMLIPILRDGAQSHALALQFERAALLGSLKLPRYSSIGWEKVFISLSPAVRERLVDWLRDWHQRNESIIFDFANPDHAREITISVDVPTIDVVHTATLTLDSPNSDSSSDISTPQTATLGIPLRAALRIKHTRRWASPTTAPTHKTKPLNFVYTLRDLQEAWLIGGQRRAHFSFSSKDDEEEEDDHDDDEETKVFPLVLVPLKQGMQLLPSIEIQAVASSSSSSSATATEDEEKAGEKTDAGKVSFPSGGAQWMAKGQSVEATTPGGSGGANGIGGGGNPEDGIVSCETDYTTSAAMVLVVRDVRTTSFTIREPSFLFPPGGVSGGGDGASVVVSRASEETTLSQVMG